MSSYEQESETHIYFYGGVFSNFVTCHNGCAIEIDGRKISFKTSEHAFNALKAVEFGDMVSLKRIIESNYSSDAKEIGRYIKGFDDVVWERVRYDRMKQCLVAKYTQNENYRKILLETGNKVLVEARPTDKVWGVGVAIGDRNLYNELTWKGRNLLGRCLMEVRDEIANGVYDE